MPKSSGCASDFNEGKVNEPLKVLITYGTVQGTTGKIGEAIAEGMNAAGASATDIQLDLLSMMPNRIETAEVLGIGSPVYFLREAGYVSEFIANLPSLDGKKVFVFCACGMDRVGEALHRLQKGLSERGAIVIGAAHFSSAMSYLPYHSRGLGNPTHLPDEAVLATARKFGERMARARELPEILLQPVTPVTRFKAGLLANKYFKKYFLPRVRLDQEICTGYGSCLSRCPFQALEREGEESIPDFTDTCTQCMQCINFCPRAAIKTDSILKERVSALGYRLGIH